MTSFLIVFPKARSGYRLGLTLYLLQVTHTLSTEQMRSCMDVSLFSLDIFNHNVNDEITDDRQNNWRNSHIW